MDQNSRYVKRRWRSKSGAFDELLRRVHPGDGREFLPLPLDGDDAAETGGRDDLHQAEVIEFDLVAGGVELVGLGGDHGRVGHHRPGAFVDVAAQLAEVGHQPAVRVAQWPHDRGEEGAILGGCRRAGFERDREAAGLGLLLRLARASRGVDGTLPQFGEVTIVVEAFRGQAAFPQVEFGQAEFLVGEGGITERIELPGGEESLERVLRKADRQAVGGRAQPGGNGGQRGGGGGAAKEFATGKEHDESSFNGYGELRSLIRWAPSILSRPFPCSPAAGPG